MLLDIVILSVYTFTCHNPWKKERYEIAILSCASENQKNKLRILLNSIVSDWSSNNVESGKLTALLCEFIKLSYGVLGSEK